MILIRMMKLRSLIREFLIETIPLNEGVIKVPDDLVARAKDLYDWINDHYDEADPVVYPDPNDIDPKTGFPKAAYRYWHPTGHPELRSFFKIARRDGSVVPVHVGLYGGHKESGGAMDSKGTFGRTEDQIKKNPEAHFLVNLDNWKNVTLGGFKHLVHHELAHGLDPLLAHPAHERMIKAGKVAVPDDEVTDKNPIDSRTGITRASLRYRKNQAEYAAESSTRVKDLKEILKDAALQGTRNFYAVVKMISDISTSYKEWTTEEWNRVYTEKEKKYGNLFRDSQDFRRVFDLANNSFIRAWASRPTLWRKFIGDLTTELGGRPGEDETKVRDLSWIVGQIKRVMAGDPSKIPVIIRIINAVSAIPKERIFSGGSQAVFYGLYNSKKFENDEDLSQYFFNQIANIVIQPEFKKNAPSPGKPAEWKKFLSDLRAELQG